MAGGTWILTVFAFTYGNIIEGPQTTHRTQVACTQAKAVVSKRLEHILPEDYRYIAVCKPVGSFTLKELAGKDGWGCFKYGKCHGDQPDITVKIEIERQ